MTKWLLLVSLTVGIGCGPGLREQVRIRTLADHARADCDVAFKLCPVADPKAVSLDSCKLATRTCTAADACQRDSKAARNSIQDLQVARSATGATADLILLAKEAYQLSLDTCQKGGWR